ncbi:taste receptor type 2 member 16 [Perognathus longimembris pacificus]|uniref:taste receptor type 2 member 16 n=1 Tax=Perognathus longimembris pacificus TaxID=214514 RepID=UPI0020185189|nr:taste receptor type 2 member 16 [Perognathus longimembris pacificus]
MVILPVTIIFIFIYVLESLTIIAQSSFVIAVLGREWVRAKRLSPLEMILTSLSSCRFCLQLLSMIYDFCFFMNPSKIFWSIALCWEFTSHVTVWLTSLLALFYCVKVSSFTHPIFFWLRWRVLRLVPQLILGTLVIAFVTTIPSSIRSRIRLEITATEYLRQNRSLMERIRMFDSLYITPQKITALCIPFLLFLVSIILLITSLIRHWKQIQQPSNVCSNSSMKAQSSALRSLVIFLIFFTSYILSILISYLGVLFDSRSWYWAWEAAIYAIVTANSTLMMLSIPALKKVLKTKCWGPEAA